VGLLVQHAAVVVGNQLASPHIDVRLARQQRFAVGDRTGRTLQRAEPLAETDLFFVRHVLVGKDQYVVFVERGTNLGIRLVVDVGQPDAADAGTEYRAERGDGDGHGGTPPLAASLRIRRGFSLPTIRSSAQKSHRTLS